MTRDDCFCAIRLGDLDIVKNLFKSGLNTKLTDESGWTFLMVAAHHGRYQIADFLLRSGIDPNLVTLTGRSALMFAAGRHDYEIAKLLLGKGAYVDQTDQKGSTPLSYALSTIPDSREAFLLTVRELLKHRPRLDIVDSSDYTASRMLTELDDKELQSLFQEYYADI